MTKLLLAVYLTFLGCYYRYQQNYHKQQQDSLNKLGWQTYVSIINLHSSVPYLFTWGLSCVAILLVNRTLMFSMHCFDRTLLLSYTPIPMSLMCLIWRMANMIITIIVYIFSQRQHHYVQRSISLDEKSHKRAVKETLSPYVSIPPTHTPPNNTFAEMAMPNLTLAMILNIPDIVPQQIMLYLIQYNIKDS